MELDTDLLYAIVDAFNRVPFWQIAAFGGAIGSLIGDFGYGRLLRPRVLTRLAGSNA